MMLVRTTTVPLLLTLLGGLACLGTSTSFSAASMSLAPADDPQPVSAPVPDQSRMRLQDVEETLQPLDPLKPRTKADQSRGEALAWFMTGRLKESGGDYRGAYSAYRKAAKLDPKSVAIYRALVPLAFLLKLNDDAVKYATEAVKLDPDDYLLLRRLGFFLAKQRKVPEAIDFLERALKSSKLKQTSSEYVTINRDLGILYGATGKKEQAADAYAVVLDSLIHRNKYDIDPRTRAMLEVDPTTSFERLGQVFLDVDRIELAIQAFEHAAKARRGKPGNLSYNLARVYQRTKQFDKALDQLQKYFDAQLQSKGREAYELLAKILKSLEKSDELIGRLEAIAEKDSRNATLQLYLAEQFLANDQLDKAEAFYKRGLESSTNTGGYIGLASIYRRQGRAADLLEALAKALEGARSLQQMQGSVARLESEIKAIGQDEKVLDGLIAAGRELSAGDDPKLRFAASFILAKLASVGGQSAVAIEFYRFALKKAPPERSSIVFSELGEELLDLKKYDEAAEVFRQAADVPALAQQQPNWLYRLSQALEINGKTEEALKAISEARQKLPDHPLLHFQEAWIHYHSHQWDKAIGLFEQVIAKFSQPKFNNQPLSKNIVRRSQFSLSAVYVQKGEMAKGEAILEKILAEEPDNPSVNNDLGYLWADQGKNLERAEKMIRKAIEAEPENAAYLDSMGWVLYKLEKFDEALPHLEKAVSKPTGSDATIWDHLGDCYQKLNKPEKAKDSWQKALDETKQQSPADEKIIKKLEEKLKEKK